MSDFHEYGTTSAQAAARSAAAALRRPHLFFESIPALDFGAGWPVEVKRPAVSVPPVALPVEPKPEPETSSVQMLRGLLDQRRAERAKVEAAKASRTAQAEEAEKRARDLRDRIANDETHLSLVDVDIAAVERDIATLTGLQAPLPFGVEG